MSWKRSTLFLFLLVFAGAMSLATTAGAVVGGPCSVETVATVVPPDAPGAPPAPASSGNGGVGLIANAAPSGGPTLNQEGETERPADLLIYDNGNLTTGPGTSCFPAGAQVVITYNAGLTTPNPVVTNSSDLDVMDSAGTSGLVVSVATSVGLSTFDTPQTVITITVLQAGTHSSSGTGVNLLNSYTGSAIRLKNLRFDVTSLVGRTSSVQATISTSNPVTVVDGADMLGGGSDLETVGTISSTINPDSTFLGEGTGFQSYPPGLCTPADVEFGEEFGNAFRTAITSQAVYKDITTGDMSLIFNVTNIPSGVTVTFPSTLANSVTGGGALVFTARSSTLAATGGSLAVIYDTTVNGTSDGGMDIDTANAAGPSPNATDTDGPQIGVAVGSSTGAGTAKLQVVFGPTDGNPVGTGAFTGDDVQPSAIPRYIPSVSTSTPPSRNILNGNFFTINPVETVLLYPYATDEFGFATGLEVANTGASNNIFFSAACFAPATNGTITFYFFPSNGTPFSYTPVAGVGRGLDATTGNLDAGSIFADTLDDLITKAGQSSMVGKFDGYVMAVTNFNYAHGIGLVLNASNGNSVMSDNALVVGPFTGDILRGGQLGSFFGFPETLGSVTKRKH